jgi:hypothetical protein
VGVLSEAPPDQIAAQAKPIISSSRPKKMRMAVPIWLRDRTSIHSREKLARERKFKFRPAARPEKR